MTYKIVSKPHAWWPIRFNGVTEEGEIVTNEIQGRFVILDEDEFKQLETDMMPALLGDAADNADKPLSAQFVPFVQRMMVDWKDVLDEDGSSLPFNPENLGRLLRVPNFAWGVATAFREVRRGEPERRKGN